MRTMRLMTPEEFEERVKACEWAVHFGQPSLAYLDGARVLDIGCGFGAMAVACQRAGVAAYLGVDPWPFGAYAARMEGRDPGWRLAYEWAMPSEARDKFCFFEGYVEQIRGFDPFDVAVSFDVLEHVPQPAMRSLARAAFERLRPGGIMIAISGPLWYSSAGHHLWGTSRGGPWAHLAPGYRPTTRDEGVSTYRLACHETLGRCTHAQIRSAFTDAGFAVTIDHIQPDSAVLWAEHKHAIDPAILGAVPERVFMEHGSELCFRKP